MGIFGTPIFVVFDVHTLLILSLSLSLSVHTHTYTRARAVLHYVPLLYGYKASLIRHSPCKTRKVMQVRYCKASSYFPTIREAIEATLSIITS